MAQTEVIELLRLYILMLNKAGLEVRKAFLYGSYARNEATEESDIDVMIISENFDDHNVEAKAKAWQLTSKVDRRIEPFAISLKKYIANDSALLNEVRKEGIEIAIG